MPADAQQIVSTWSPDGTGTAHVETFVPSADNLWYVDDVRVFCDGAGGTANSYGGVAGIFPQGVNPSAADYNAPHYGTSVNVTDNNKNGESGPIGGYLTDSEEFRVAEENGGAASAATYWLVATLRRVL